MVVKWTEWWEEQKEQERVDQANLSNILFNPDDGLITKAYPTREEREAFIKTEQYRCLRKLLQKQWILITKHPTVKELCTFESEASAGGADLR